MNLRLFLLITAVATVFFGCDEDFEVFAPYKTVPVVFGVLNTNDTTHYIKINRTFQGEGDNLEAAQIADSTAIEVSNVQVEFLNTNGTVVKTTMLTRDTLEPRQPGDFYTAPNVVYTFNESDLIRYASARLSFVFNGETLTAETPIVGDLDVDFPLLISEVKFVNNDISGGDPAEYVDTRFSFNSAENGRRYEASIRMDYMEYYTNAAPVRKTFEVTVLNRVLQATIAGIELETNMSGDFFLQRLANSIDENPEVTRREILDPSYQFDGISEDLYIYEQSTNTAIGLGQEIVTYSNVFYEDGTPALGVFGSSSSKTREHKFAKNTLVAMINGEFTQGLKFCSNQPELVLSFPQGACD